MRPVEAKGIGTMATDKHWRLYYDPDFVASRPIEVLCSAIIHEIGHNLLNHHERMKSQAKENPLMANIAGDLAINCNLMAEQDEEQRSKGKPTIRCESTWQYPKTYGFEDFLSAEEYWDKLKDKFDPDNKGACSAKFGPQGDQPAIGEGVCGSSAHGQKMPWEQPGPGDDGHDPDKHETGVGPAEADVIRDEVARQMIDHASRNQGKFPAGMLRWANQRLKSTTNYGALINYSVRSGVSEAFGFTHMRYGGLHRRQQAYGEVIMPTKYRKIPRVAIGIDTSGSMSDLMLSQALAEVEAALRAYRCEVHVLTGDYGVHTAKKVFRASQVELRGGGGTDVGLTIAAVAELRPKIDLGIYITDCYTPWPAEAPKHKVVIIRTAQGEPPPWHCRVIDVDPTEYAEQIGKKGK